MRGFAVSFVLYQCLVSEILVKPSKFQLWQKMQANTSFLFEPDYSILQVRVTARELCIFHAFFRVIERYLCIIHFPLISVPVVHVRDDAGTYKIPSWAEAASKCTSQGMRLATRDQLEDARKMGLDVCACGWLADGTVGYPILKPRNGCGGSEPAGVRTCSSTPSGVGWDAYCTKSACEWQ